MLTKSDGRPKACRLEVDEHAGTAVVLLARPTHRNAFSLDLAADVDAALDHIEAEAGVRAVVLAGEGPAFCVGGDVALFAAELADGSLLARVTRDMAAFNPLIERLATFRLPMVAALHGAVAGGGLALAAACDLRVCAPETVFAPGFAGLGLPPDTGTSWLLPRLMGAGRAADFLLRNRRLDADTALAVGLVNEVVADPVGRAEELAAELAGGPSSALADTKRLLLDSSRRSLREQLDAEAAAVGRALHGDELPEGVAAFVAKRPPAFPS